jgi:hypothetical protein
LIDADSRLRNPRVVLQCIRVCQTELTPRREETTMRYTLAILALGLGLSAVMPAAFASEHEGGRDLTAPVVTAQTGPSDTGTIAGPTMNQNQFDDRGHDRN